MLLVHALVVVLLVLLKFYQSHQASDYDVFITDLASDCPGKPDSFSLSNYLDSNHLEYSWGDRGDLILNGYTFINVDLDPNQKVLFKATVLKYVQRQWVQTLFSVERKDICLHLLDPKDLFGEAYIQLEADQKSCPPKKDAKFMLRNKTIELRITAPSMDMEGIYRFVLSFVTKEISICTMVEAKAVKIME